MPIITYGPQAQLSSLGIVTLTPSGDTTGATDAARLQALLNAVGSAGGQIYLSRGTFYLNGTVSYAGSSPVALIGQGTEATGGGGVTKIKAVAGSTFAEIGTSGLFAVLSFAPAANVNDFRFEEFYVDMTGSTNTVGLYCDQVGYSRFKSLKFREGAIGFAGLRLAACDMVNLHAWNQATYGFAQLYTDGTATVGTNGQANSWLDCEFRMTAAVNSCTAGFAVLSNQQDVNFVNCHAQRAGALGTGLQYGFLLSGNSATWPPGAGQAAQAHLVQCNADATVDSAQDGAGFAFINYHHARLDQSWSSAMDVSNAWYQPAILVSNSQDVTVRGCEISGTGVSLSSNVDLLTISECHFLNAASAPVNCITIGSSTLSNLVVNANTKKSATAPWFDSQALASAALNSATQGDRGATGVVTVPYTNLGLPTGAKGSNVPRNDQMGNQAFLSTQRLSLTQLPLSGLDPITSVSWVSNATPLAVGTNLWAVLVDSSLNVVRQSTDQLSAAWSASVPFTFTLDSIPVTAGARAASTTVTLTFPTLSQSLTTLVAPGDSVVVSNANIAAYNGTFTVVTVTATQITYVSGGSATDSLAAPFPTVQLAAAKRAYTPPSPALYYAGLMSKAGTVPTITGPTSQTAVTGISPILCGSSSTGLTGTCPSPAGALSGLGGNAFVYWS